MKAGEQSTVQSWAEPYLGHLGGGTLPPVKAGAPQSMPVCQVLTPCCMWFPTTQFFCPVKPSLAPVKIMGIVTALWVLVEQSTCFGLEPASIHFINLSVLYASGNSSPYPYWHLAQNSFWKGNSAEIMMNIFGSLSFKYSEEISDTSDGWMLIFEHLTRAQVMFLCCEYSNPYSYSPKKYWTPSQKQKGISAFLLKAVGLEKNYSKLFSLTPYYLGT